MRIARSAEQFAHDFMYGVSGFGVGFAAQPQSAGFAPFKGQLDTRGKVRVEIALHDK
jgi:hypothetical protein